MVEERKERRKERKERKLRIGLIDNGSNHNPPIEISPFSALKKKIQNPNSNPHSPTAAPFHLQAVASSSRQEMTKIAEPFFNLFLNFQKAITVPPPHWFFIIDPLSRHPFLHNKAIARVLVFGGRQEVFSGSHFLEEIKEDRKTGEIEPSSWLPGFLLSQ